MSEILITDRIFHLRTQTLSYIIGISRENHLLHLYFGDRLNPDSDGLNLFPSEKSLYGGSIDYLEKAGGYQPDRLTFEYPGGGKGDFRTPAYQFISQDGNRVFDFKYDSYRIENSLIEPVGLPGFVGNGKTLSILLKDTLYSIELILSYLIPDDSCAIGRYASIKNLSQSALTIDKMASFSFDFDPGYYDFISLDGQWIRERHMHRISLPEGERVLSSRKGMSSPDHSPFAILCDCDTNENQGRAWGAAFVYSGNHRTVLEKSSFGNVRFEQGINPELFQWHLESKETFVTPVSLLSVSSHGLNGLSQNFHEAFRNNIVRGKWKEKDRPILINNWEATYFDFNEKKLLKLADEAASLGMELFVLDDGWFGKRNDDTSSLGDWKVNYQKLPRGLDGLAEKIRKKGMLFGIWVEPEMISIDSCLYRTHPEWLMKCPGREASPGRNQYLLDLTRNDVVDYLIESLSDVFASADIAYVKWDFNRSLSDVYSSVLPPERQEESYHRYYQGLYRLLDTIVKRFPDILFESCASGGSRFDAGMTAYMPQVWTSDNTDASERVSIQEGSSYFAPLSIMGAHVSDSPNHQVIRRTSLESRFNTAAFGLLGYELDLTRLNNAEKKIIKRQIEFYKKYRELLQWGKFYRIPLDPTGNKKAWLSVNSDQSLAILGYYQAMARPNPGMERIRLTGLKEEALYDVFLRDHVYDMKYFGELINHALPVKLKEDGAIHKMVSENFNMPGDKFFIQVTGKQLMFAGLRPNQQFAGIGLEEYVGFVGDFGSRLFVIREVK